MTKLSKRKLEELAKYASRRNRVLYFITTNTLAITIGLILIEYLENLVYKQPIEWLEYLKRAGFGIVWGTIFFGIGAVSKEKKLKKMSYKELEEIRNDH